MMTLSIRSIPLLPISLAFCLTLAGCAGDPLESGVDPFAPMVFKEGVTAMPLNPPNATTIQPFYVSQQTIFKFAVDTDSILIGNDGVTRYIVILTSPNGNSQVQYEGIRCDSFQWRLYGTFESGTWKENPLSSWRPIQDRTPNRYQAALAQGAFCNFNSQEKNIKTIIKSLNPNGFTGQTKPTNSFGLMN
ncbi:CNP1-like family protein [Polynucleobacter sp. CS-Odin-A6]|uniref:CNP1-like family protein n=1 Tax=Polynucleobacter sp. CS-Odin-A6 TaxID=2689106 RepID=UPI001D9AF3EB|nr:CNP1-like family protein [Polynucleobacter sp. CS-Odin-A6]MBU3621244.1 CNP1-like family protein [Polynucleobacter sp. CS-Odin-A6]